VDEVEHVRAWRTAVVATRDGGEQRHAQTLAPREGLTYRLTAASAEDGTAVWAVLARAATAPTPAARGRVRLPRWEHGLVLVAPAAVGDPTLTVRTAPGDAPGAPWAGADALALWRDGAPVTAVAADPTTPPAETAASDVWTLTLAQPLTADDAPGAGGWPAGTLVAPVCTGRLDDGGDWTRATGAVAETSLAVTLDTAIDGTEAARAPGSPGHRPGGRAGRAHARHPGRRPPGRPRAGGQSAPAHRDAARRHGRRGPAGGAARLDGRRSRLAHAPPDRRLPARDAGRGGPPPPAPGRCS
jgi:hypothetical protein